MSMNGSALLMIARVTLSQRELALALFLSYVPPPPNVINYLAAAGLSI